MTAWISSITFLLVLLLIMGNVLSPPVAALAGAIILIFCGVFTISEAAAQVTGAYSTLALLLGVMIVVRILTPTGLFGWLARAILIAAGGRGSRLLLSVALTTALLSSFLPNATVVLVMGSVLMPLAREYRLSAPPLLILLVLAANTGGLLTMVGDPATYLVSQAAGLSFVQYLKVAGANGMIGVLILLLLLPVLWRQQWRLALTLEREGNGPPPLPWRQLLPVLLVGVVMLLFFVGAELSHLPVSPDLVALTCAVAALALAERFLTLPAAEVLRDIDWSTLLFLSGIFILTGALEETGVIASISRSTAVLVDSQPQTSLLLLLAGTALLSSMVPNIPLLAASLPLVESLVSGEAQLPFYSALLLGGTLGGNITIFGAAANMVAVGLAKQEGVSISFVEFLRYGLPLCFLQLTVIHLCQLATG